MYWYYNVFIIKKYFNIQMYFGKTIPINFWYKVLLIIATIFTFLMLNLQYQEILW